MTPTSSIPEQLPASSGWAVWAVILLGTGAFFFVIMPCLVVVTWVWLRWMSVVAQLLGVA